MGGRHASTGPRRITRYANRKLYDPAARRYVTLDDLAAIVSRGEELVVTERGSGEDITALVLAQVVLEGIRQRTARIPHPVLARLIRLGRDRAVEAVGEWTPPQDTAARARDEAERIVGDLVRRGRLSLEEALALRQEVAQTVHRVASDAQHGLEARLHGWLDRAGREVAGLAPAVSVIRDRLLALGAGAAAEAEPDRAGSRRTAKRSARPKPTRARRKNTK